MSTLQECVISHLTTFVAMNGFVIKTGPTNSKKNIASHTIKEKRVPIYFYIYQNEPIKCVHINCLQSNTFTPQIIGIHRDF